MKVDEELLAKAATAWRFLYRRGFIEGFGHLSVRLPDAGLCIATRHSLGAKVRPEDFLVLDLDGRKVAGKGAMPGEIPIHLEIYKARSDVGSVVHYHGMYSTAFTTTEYTLKPIHLSARMFSDGIPLYDDPMPIQDATRGAALATTLGPHRAVLMTAHGATVVGPTLEEAVGATYTFEQNAHRAYLSASMGRPIWLDPKAVAGAALAPGKGRGPFARLWQMVESEDSESDAR